MFSKTIDIPRICVMVPVYYRGDRSVNFIWKNFCKQNYSNKKLFVCRNKDDKDSSEECANHYQFARKEWAKKQEKYPESLKYWEEENYDGLGPKRNLMLREMLKPEHACEYIVAFDDDDVYASNYLAVMYSYFKKDGRVQLVNFRDFLGIQTSGTPVTLQNPATEKDGALVQALERSRAFLEVLPGKKTPKSSQQLNKWHVHSRGGILPSGFGFSFMFRASAVRDKTLDIQYGEESQNRSGEEDVFYKRVKKKFGDDAIVNIPISQSIDLAVHMENGENISGDTSTFHFPTEDYVVVPRPLSFVPTEFLRFLADYHPSKAIKNWAETVYYLKSRHPFHRTMTFVANQHQTRKFAELWQRESQWVSPGWSSKSRWFVPPIRQPIPAGQDIPIEAHFSTFPWKIKDEDSAKPAFENPTQCSLVTVPGSHLEYKSRIKKQMEILQEKSVTDKSIIIPTGHGVKVWEIWSRSSQKVREYEQQARQLDIRSMCQGTSCMLLWNSAMLHQGTVSIKPGTLVKKEAFVPRLLTPSVFPVDATEEWRRHLEKEGYVILRNVLGEKMDTYLECLLEDINKINPNANLKSLHEVKDLHLGLSRRGLLYTLGFPHGKFAWAIRQHEKIQDIWKDLYQTQEVMGSIDVPAITLSDPNFTVVDNKTHDEWLHWDQNPLLEPVGKQKMFQSMVYLFPDETSKVGGNNWNRIAMVICMVPTLYDRSIQAEKTLLSLAITGEASNHWPQLGNANYGWNGMRIEQMKEKYPNLTEQQIELEFSDRCISEQQMQENGWKRLFAELNPDITRSNLLKYIRRLKICKISLETQTKEQLKEILCSVNYQKLRKLLNLDDLRHIVHPQVKNYVKFIADL